MSSTIPHGGFPFPTTTVGLTPEQINDLSSYGYVPTEWICIMFVVFFSVSTAGHFVQASYFRMWWLMPTIVLGGIGEIIGWSGRLWSNRNILLDVPFLMQISTTIIAPTFLTAANFIMLGRVVGALGPQYSRLTPKAYTTIFITADVVALVVQAVGGGLASSAEDPRPGGHIMLGGIAIQMAAITIYTIVAVEFFVRYLQDRPMRELTASETAKATGSSSEVALKPYRGEFTSRLQLMTLALGISTLFIFMRSVYRTIELSNGWNGRIITTQVYFNVLEGMPITVAMYTMNILHPGLLLPKNGNIAGQLSYA